mgnify:CR=1 FL=1
MNPLNFIIDDSSLRHQRIETTTIYPRTINDNVDGGLVRFVLPNKGFLSANTCIVLPATCVEECYQYAPNAGVYSLLKVARLSCGDQVISEIQNVGQLLAQKKLAESQEVREKMSQVKEGINFSFESASGSKRDGDLASIEILQGQQRLVMDEYEKEEGLPEIVGRKNAPPNVMNGKIHSSYKLKTFSQDTSDEAGTPEFFIYLRDLFGNYFGSGLELPLQLINRNEEIAIEIQFSNDGDLAVNERAIVCPSLQSNKKTGVTSLALVNISGTVTAGKEDEDFEIEITEGDTGRGLVARICLEDSDILLDEGYGITVLSCGSGYTGEDLTCTHEGLTYTFQPAFRMKSSESGLPHFQITTVGTGYVTGDTVLKSNDNEDCNCNVSITANAGALTEVKFKTEEDKNRFLFSRGGIYKIEGGNGDGRVRPSIAELSLTNLGALTGAFTVGMQVKTNNDPDAVAYVAAIDGDDKPTELYYQSGTFESGDTIQNDDNSVNCVVGTIGSTVLALQVGLNSSGQYAFDNNKNDKGQHIQVVTDKVQMLADIIYYEDDTVANMIKQMNAGGVNQVYTEYRNIQTTCTQTSVDQYDDKNRTEHIRLIGFSNEVLRNILIQNMPDSSVKQENLEFPNYDLPNKNPLLGQYCSRDSLARDGVELNINVNSVPFFASAMNFNPQFYEELTYCHNSPLYVPHAGYCGWTSAKQLDNSAANVSQQPAFSDLDSLTDATQRYELNDRCAGMCNQLYEGVGQEFMRGNLNYMGVSFQTSPAKGVLGNGIAVGSQAVEIQYTYNTTYNPLYNGNSILNIYGEVERLLVLDSNGRITVSNASSRM